MLSEIETKFLAVDHDALRTRLKSLQATCAHKNRLTKRLTFDYPDQRLRRTANGWVRLRDEGDRITLSYKQLNDRTISGMKEIELVVDDFKKTESFLQAIGFQSYNYQETKRESWILGEVKIDLDEWPWIPPFVEIEGSSEAAVWQVAEKLGLARENALFGSVENAYQAEYDVTENEIDDWKRVTFTPIPDWLKARTKK